LLATWVAIPKCATWQTEASNEYLSKGRQVLVEGRLRVDPNTGGPTMFTRNDGTVGASFEIVADTVRFIGSREKGAGNYSEEEPSLSGGNARGGGGSAAQEEDDIPF